MHKNKPHQDESTTKTSDAAFFLAEDSAEAMMVQTTFISFLARKLEKISPGTTHNECLIRIVAKTGAPFREWFSSLAKMETAGDFIMTYGTTEGPKRIFSELFPDRGIEDFLRSCLNDDDSNPASIRSNEVHEKALNSIK
jgi:hypothetical protein